MSVRRVAAPLGLLLLAHVAFAAAFWDRPWDDSAITLAFARVLAATGTVAPTAASDAVEGSSTVLWMLVHAALAPLLAPAGQMAVAQALALALNLLGIVLVYGLAARHLRHPAGAVAVAVAYGTLTAVWAESVNGMETPLYVVLYLAAVWAWERGGRRGAFLAATVALLVVRWEAAWYLLPFVALRVRRDGPRGLFAAEHFVWGAVFAGLTLWRWAAFGVLVPNTVLAKRWPPYTPDGSAAWAIQHGVPLAVFAVLCAPLALTAGLALAAAWRESGRARAAAALREASQGTALLALIVVATLIFNAIAGDNWGPKGRMLILGLPAAFVMLARVAEAGWSAARSRRAIATVGIVLVAAGAAWQTTNAVGNVREDPVVVDAYRRVGAAVEAVRVGAGRERLVYAGPDMGGLLLFHGDHLRVLDIAYLCDPVLGAQGPAGVRRRLFATAAPADVIETHAPWTETAGLAAAPELSRDYAVLFVDGMRFFVRRPLLAALRRRGAPLRDGAFDATGAGGPYDAAQAPSGYQGPADLALNRAARAYAVLERPAR